MSERHGLSRRQFLVLSAACGASLVARSSIPSWLPIPDRSSPVERLTGLLRHRSSARVIGAAYLRHEPSEAQVTSLVDLIAGGFPGGVGALRSADDALRGLLARRVEQDFAEERIVCLDGWIVSRTEGRLCGLAALT